MAIELEKVVLDDLLPDSIAKDEGVAAAAKAIDPQLQIASGFVDIPSIYVSIDRQSSTALDHLATQYDVSVWRDTWPLAVKRSVLKTAIADKRRKGTVEAVKQALASVSSAAVIREWWQKTPKGEPHTFEIVATQADVEGTIDVEMQEDIVSLVDDAKPLRSHYTLTIRQNAKGGINAAAYLRPLVLAQIYPTDASEVRSSGTVGIVAAVRPLIKRRLVLAAEESRK